MNAHKKPPFRRRRLGKRLRALRESAGMTLEVAAARLDKNRSSLTRIESGEYKADVHLIRSMMDLYDRRDDDLLEAARAALKPSWFAAYNVRDMGYIDLETEASCVYDYPGMHLPGLLHAEPYIRALFGHAYRRQSANQLQNDITVRLIRQKRLTSEEDPLELVAIIDEAALHREVGGPEVMRAQFDHLLAMAALPTVTLQVLRMNGGPPRAMDGAFTLLEFEGESDLLYHEYVSGALHIEDEREVREARLVFDALRTEALNPAESVAMIERLV